MRHRRRMRVTSRGHEFLHEAHLFETLVAFGRDFRQLRKTASNAAIEAEQNCRRSPISRAPLQIGCTGVQRQEMQMKNLILTQNFGRRLKQAAMAAAAVGALLAGTPAAYAWDQQATGAEMDYSLSREAAGMGSGYYGSYAQGPEYFGGPYSYAHRARSHRHAR
jgi:hypothetical protein